MATKDEYRGLLRNLHAQATLGDSTSGEAAEAIGLACDDRDRTAQTANEELARRMQIRDQCRLTLDELATHQHTPEVKALLEDLRVRLSE